MALSGIQKFAAVVGTIAGFIPGVSTITGVVKYFIYKGCAKTCEESKERMQRLAEKTSSLANKNFNLDPEKQECYVSLSKSSILEIIPGVNFFAAAYSASKLHKLFKMEEIEKNPAAQKEYLFEKYHVSQPTDAEQRKCLGEIAMIIDSLDIQSKVLEEKKSSYTTTYRHILNSSDVKESLIAYSSGAIYNKNLLKKPPLEIVKWVISTIIQEQEQELPKLQNKVDELDKNYADMPQGIKELLLRTNQDNDEKVRNALEYKKLYLIELRKALASLGDKQRSV